MTVLMFNFFWMAWNLFLAGLGWLFAWLFCYHSGSKLMTWVYGLLWLLFVPNTIYILTDIKHLPIHWVEVTGWGRLALMVQYNMFITLGVMSFFYSLWMVEKKWQKQFQFFSSKTVFIALNFIIAFGVIMGRVQRTNSWEVFTNIHRVIQDGLAVMTSPLLMLAVIGFGFIINLIYFAYRQLVTQLQANIE